MNIIVTGGNGQLGQSIQHLTQSESFKFIDRNELDLSNATDVETYFNDLTEVAAVINCAAYTAVDQAEENIESATLGNVESAKNLANVCHLLDVPLIHISTDFVFDGSQNQPINEQGTPAPLSVYGATKLEGEVAIQSIHSKSIIIRTSWLYSEFGNNFVKTMIRLGNERENLNVINDQYGTPTYAGDLAEFILNLIDTKKWKFGLYHFSNEGCASWYDFAWNIMRFKNIACKVSPITTQEYPTPAKRPQFSVMDKTKLKLTFGYQIPHWLKSLETCLERIKQ